MNFDHVEQQYIEKHQQQYSASDDFDVSKQQMIMGPNQFQGQLQNQAVSGLNGPQSYQQINQLVTTSSAMGSPSGQGRKMPPTPRTQSQFMQSGTVGSPMNQQQQHQHTTMEVYDQQFGMHQNMPSNMGLQQFNQQKPSEDKQSLQQQQQQHQQLQQNNQILHEQIQSGQIQHDTQFEPQMTSAQKQQIANRGNAHGTQQYQPTFDQRQQPMPKQQPQSVKPVRSQPSQPLQTHPVPGQWHQPQLNAKSKSLTFRFRNGR